ncbi:hypothetical protein [Micrococcus sp. TA1]|uniref:hypothetical protein n=1 Tax=Micrococcus sp. TA1 TaxID=681627 RepID=UPI00161F4A7D|nr:hypothetical protein [Micrococcus sp. TA1]MBB5747750.1 hypothetical protein [Micrococcus sp. TA1]
MEYLVPALIVVVVGAIVGGGAWWLSRRASSATPEPGAAGQRRRGRRSLAGRVSSESARVASGRLDQESHREIYRLIAAGRTSDAVMAYRQSTGLGTFESMLDVQALATFPQMWVRPGAAPGPASAADTGTAVQPQPSPEQARPPEPRDSATEEVPDTTNLVVPQDWLTDALPADRPFELEVVRDETTVRVSSADLPPFLRDQLTAMVRDGRIEEAALELSAHTVLTAEESLQFLHILQREQGQDD